VSPSIMDLDNFMTDSDSESKQTGMFYESNFK
jgi:hypothetical protein